MVKTDILRLLREPPFGTETSERNIMSRGADEIEFLRKALEEISKMGIVGPDHTWSDSEVTSWLRSVLRNMRRTASESLDHNRK
jgi:hypothetical protein